MRLTNPGVSSAQKTKAAPQVDVLSSDYAEMTLGTTSSGGRSTGPTLSPKENIKKLKSSFFGCGDTSSETDYVNYNATESNQLRAPRKKSDDNDVAGDYALMNPKAKIPLTSHAVPVVLPTKKSILFTTSNNPDKVLANTQSKADGFKPISSNFDSEMRSVKNQSPKSMAAFSSASSSTFNRQHSAPVPHPQSTCQDNGAYELLELRGSNTEPIIVHGRSKRPNSVNSEKFTKHSSGASGATTFSSSTRPNSANSELHTISASSSSSSSSMLCGSSSNECDSSSTTSTSTILRPQSSSFLSSGSEYSASSRPSSVVSMADPALGQSSTMLMSRPPSVSSERELHYSILDLPPCSNSSSSNLISNNNNSNIASTQTPEQSTFTYAQIDFDKSGESSAQQYQQQ